MSPKIKLECCSCTRLYSYEESTATEQNRSLYCSDTCEGEETQRLAEGNEIVRKALDAEPLSLNRTLGPLAPTQVGEINGIVDGVFSRLGIKK